MITAAIDAHLARRARPGGRARPLSTSGVGGASGPRQGRKGNVIPGSKIVWIHQKMGPTMAFMTNRIGSRLRNATLLAAGKHLRIYRVWPAPTRLAPRGAMPATFAAVLGAMQIELPRATAECWARVLTPQQVVASCEPSSD